MDYTPGNTFDFVSGSYSPTTVFDFTVETPDETLATITAVLDGLSACIQAEHVRFFAEIGATLEDMVGGLLAEYDVNVQRFITTRPEIRWQDATAGVGLQSLLSRDQATRNDHKAISVQQQTVPANIKAVLETDQAIRMDGQLQIDIEQAPGISLHT